MRGIDVKEKLKKTGIPLSQIAEKLGMSNQNLFGMFTVEDVKTGFIERLSAALGIPISEFYGENIATASGENSTAVAGNGNQLNTISEKYISLLEKKDEQIDRLISIIEKQHE